MFLVMYSVGLYSINTSDRRQSKTLILSKNLDLRSLETEFFYCHLSPDCELFLVALVSHWFGLVFSRQMAIENTFSSDL